MDDLTNIIAGCKKGDRLSQERLYKQFYPALFALCKSFFADNQDTVTALNNGMLKVFKNIGHFDTEKGTLFSWIYTIVRNAALTHVRSKAVIKEVSFDGEDVHAVSENPFADKPWDDVYALLNRLPTVTRTVATLFYIHDYTVKEISAALSVKESTVKWHLHEGRTKMRSSQQKNLNKSA